MNKQNAGYTIVPMIFPITQDGALTSDILNLKNFAHADVYIQIGTVTKAGAVTLHQGTSVSAAATALTFTKYFSTGFRLKYTGASTGTPAAAGETVTGAGGGVGYVYQDTGSEVIGYYFNGTTYVTGETLTFSGGKTAVANGIQIDTDIMVPRTASSNTFDAGEGAVAARQYCIPIDASMLTDGYSCIEVHIADMDTTGVCAFAVLSDGRYMGNPTPTAIY